MSSKHSEDPEIGAQIARFLAAGGKTYEAAHGEVAINHKNMKSIHDENWRASAERTKAAGTGSVNIKSRKRGPDLRLGTSRQKEKP